MSRTNVTRRYRLSQKFKAPLDYVYKWCTDFREDDYKYIHSSARRTFHEKSKRRYIWTVKYKDGGKTKEGVRVVWFNPPNAWHLDTCGDGRELGDYKITALGKNRARLDMVFDVTYDNPRDVESKAEWERESRDHWRLYAAALEKDYNSHRK